MEAVKVILLCGSRFAIPALREMYFFQQLAAVVIPRHCKEMIEETREALTGSGIPVLLVGKDDLADQLNDAIKKYSVNIGLIATFSYLIPSSVYSLPAKGFFNVHPGPLPEYRGPDPIFRQMKNGESLAGVTIHKLTEEMDTGSIVMKEMIRIEKEDTYGLLSAKLAQTAAGMIRSLLKLAGFGMAIPSRPQDESKAVYHKRQGAKDISIDWNAMDADSVISLINACNPWNKGAVTKINNKIIRLVEAVKLTHADTGDAAAGTITGFAENGMVVSMIRGEAIRVNIVYTDEGFFPAGRLGGFGLRVGNQFEIIGE